MRLLVMSILLLKKKALHTNSKSCINAQSKSMATRFDFLVEKSDNSSVNNARKISLKYCTRSTSERAAPGSRQAKVAQNQHRMLASASPFIA